uniref:Uncharacterized protein n=1 Tax=Anguilla anguilla TaxID=7936 RepID=A0A0E9VP28_ANGAN
MCGVSVTSAPSCCHILQPSTPDP